MLWSPVLGRTRYTPLCPQKTRISIHFLKILWYFWKIFEKIQHFGSPNKHFWVKTDRGPLEHYFTSVQHDCRGRGDPKHPKITPKSPKNGFSVIFWSEMTTFWVP